MLKNILIRKIGHNLPSEYQEVKYIESTGTQYIVTDIDGGDNSLHIFIKYSFTELVPSGIYRGIIGNYIDEDTDCTRILFYGKDITYSNLNCIAKNPVVYNSTRYINTIYKDELYLSYNKVYYKTNEVELNREVVKGDPNYSNLYLFVQKLPEYDNVNALKAKLYEVKIFAGSTILRHLIPCYRKEDNKSGLYDIINNDFFVNANILVTTDFIVGKDIK